MRLSQHTPVQPIEQISPLLAEKVAICADTPASQGDEVPKNWRMKELPLPSASSGLLQLSDYKFNLSRDRLTAALDETDNARAEFECRLIGLLRLNRVVIGRVLSEVQH